MQASKVKLKGKVHIAREGYGKQPALCGANPQVMIHGGPASATCKRCLTHPIAKNWGNNA